MINIGYVLSNTDITTISNSFNLTSQFLSMFFMAIGAIVLMLPIAKYLIYKKDMRDWQMLTLITEMGLEEQDLKNQAENNVEIWIQNMQELVDLDVQLDASKRYGEYMLDEKFRLINENGNLQKDLALLQAMVEEQAAKINTQAKELAQLKRGSKKPVNVMPALTLNVVRKPISRDILPAVEDEEYMH